MASTHKILALILSAFIFAAISSLASAECSARKNALGNSEYRCSDGSKIQLRKDALERWQDTESGTTYRITPLGTVQGSDGTRYRKDALGNWQSESR